MHHLPPTPNPTHRKFLYFTKYFCMSCLVTLDKKINWNEQTESVQISGGLWAYFSCILRSDSKASHTHTNTHTHTCTDSWSAHTHMHTHTIGLHAHTRTVGLHTHTNITHALFTRSHFLEPLYYTFTKFCLCAKEVVCPPKE